MPAIRKDLTADSGSTFTVAVQYLDSNEQPVNLSGYGASMTIDTTKGAPVALITGSVTGDGWINIKATDEETALWPLGKQSYHLDLENPSGDVDRLFIGNLNVRSDVTA